MKRKKTAAAVAAKIASARKIKINRGIISTLEILFLLFEKEFREGTYPGLFPVFRGYHEEFGTFFFGCFLQRRFFCHYQLTLSHCPMI
jgi:hypothetical protein